MPSILEALMLGLEHQRAGHLPEAEIAYRAVLTAEPENVDALHLLGVIASQSGKPEASVALVRQAIRIRPNIAPFHNTLGSALHTLGLLQDAQFAFEWALSLDDGFPEAHANLGNLLQDLHRPAEAVPHYQKAMARRGDCAEILNNLGNALRGDGHPQEAVAAFRKALELNPGYAEAWVNLAAAQLETGDLREAEDACAHSLRLRPELPEAHSNMAAVLLAGSRPDRAAASAAEAARLRPDYAEAHHNLARALAELGQPDQAIPHYRRAIELKPEFRDAHLGLGVAFQNQGHLQEALCVFQQLVEREPSWAIAHYNMAAALAELHRIEEAKAGYREALRLHLGFVEAHTKLGQLFFAEKRFEEAAACCRQALQYSRDSTLYSNLAAVLVKLDRLEEAESSCRQALDVAADPEAYRTLGNIYYAHRRLDEARDCYEAALLLRPEDGGTRWNRSLLLLLRGKFEEGWQEYEWRWTCLSPSRREFPQPAWDGSPLAGRRILLYAEQGLGDTIQFLRYAPILQQMGGRVILECQPRLLNLLAGQPLEAVIGRADPLPEFDVHAPLLSLPRICRTTVANVPAQVPYIKLPQARVAAWQERLQSTRGYGVGVAWAGDPQHPNDRNRSLPAACLSPLLEVSGIRWICLQQGAAAEQSQPPFEHFEGCDDISERAAQVANLDLVITADTMLAHLAGALGRPVWVMLPFAADFRWLLDREDSPWYPTMRLFRQPRPGDWQSVLVDVLKALRHEPRP